MKVPIGISPAQCGGRGWIGAKAQVHERRWSPVRPVSGLICGMDESPQPTVGAIRLGNAAIARARDNCNRQQPRYPAPLFPAVKLHEAILPHQPDETALGVSVDKCAECVDNEARAQLLLNGCHKDAASPRHFLGRGKARGKRSHILRTSFQRITRRDEPPDFIHPQRPRGGKADPPVAAMGRVEGPAEKGCGDYKLGFQSS
jgi:hypothetical protein